MRNDGAKEWLRSVFAESSTFDVEVHRERVWGDIWKVHVDDGLHWFKSGHPALRREVRLRRLLEALVPDMVLPMVASDEVTGWMVTRDQGPTLAGRAREEGPHHYVELAATMGRLQRSVSTADLEPLELPTFRTEESAANLDEVLRWFAALPTDHPCHASSTEVRKSVGAMEAVAARWREVRPDVPELSVEHNDLHAGNAYPGPRISDWGDAVVGHPFCSMRPLVMIAERTFGPELAAAVRRAYLAQWGDPDSLQESLDVALRLAVPQRLLAWRQLDEPALVAEYGQYIRPLWEEIGSETVSQH